MKLKQILTGVALVYGFTFVGGFVVGVIVGAGGLPMELAIVGVMISNLILSTIAFCIAGVLIKTERFPNLVVIAIICWLLTALNMMLLPEFTILQWAFSLFFILVTMGIGGGLSFLFSPATPKSDSATGSHAHTQGGLPT